MSNKGWYGETPLCHQPEGKSAAISYQELWSWKGGFAWVRRLGSHQGSNFKNWEARLTSTFTKPTYITTHKDLSQNEPATKTSTTSGGPAGGWFLPRGGPSLRLCWLAAWPGAWVLGCLVMTTEYPYKFGCHGYHYCKRTVYLYIMNSDWSGCLSNIAHYIPICHKSWSISYSFEMQSCNNLKHNLHHTHEMLDSTTCMALVQPRNTVVQISKVWALHCCMLQSCTRFRKSNQSQGEAFSILCAAKDHYTKHHKAGDWATSAIICWLCVAKRMTHVRDFAEMNGILGSSNCFHHRLEPSCNKWKNMILSMYS